MSIAFKSKGNFSKTRKFLEKIKEPFGAGDMRKFGEMGVAALEKATPVESGKTAHSWSYKIINDRNSLKIEWHNDNMSQGVPVAILIEYGHMSAGGYHVQANDFINPAMKPVFDRIAEMAWGEVTKA